MNVNDIFSNISKRQIEGVMLHSELADYFKFLGLNNLVILQVERFIEESCGVRTLRNYYIQNYDKLLSASKAISKDSVIPNVWRDYSRINVSKDAKEKAVKYCIDTWVNWEQETKKYYETCYHNLDELLEINACVKMLELIRNVDNELNTAKELQLKLASNDYELQYIYGLNVE